VILGATSVAQLKENLGCLAVLPLLTPAVKAEIEAICGEGKGAPVIGKVEAQVNGVRDVAGLANFRA
jgi:hypothetical protein